MDARLRAALERLYDTFSRYPLPDGSEVCDHCVAPETVEAIRATPLRALDASAMECYAWNVSTWGSDEDFKHYLPRLMELLIFDELYVSLHAPGLTRWLGADWVNWPQDERDAIVAVVDAWWQHVLQHYPRGDVDALLMFEVIGTNLKLDLRRYLTAWEADGSEGAALHLAWLIREWDMEAPSSEDWCSLLKGWLDGPTTARVLEAALTVPSSGQIEQELSQALALHPRRVVREA